jgi:hypothetical protein
MAVNLAARQLPGDGFYPPLVKVVNAALNLFSPRRFSIVINHVAQTVQ